MPFTLPHIKSNFFVGDTRENNFPAPDPGTQHLVFQYLREKGIHLANIDHSQLLLLSLLDGHHSFEDIVTQLQERGLAISASDVAEVLDELVSMGLIEDAGVTPPQELTPYDLARYKGQIRFFSVLDPTGERRYEFQARLKRARVTVLGLGGLGCNVLIGLAAAGIGFIRAVDSDVVELSNLNRQVLYDVDDIGKSKARAARDQIQRFNPEVHLEMIECHLDSQKHIADLIKDTDVALLCVDTPEEHFDWANNASLETGIPMLSGGYQGSIAQVGPFMVPFKTSCFACIRKGGERLYPIPEQLTWVNADYVSQAPNTYVVTSITANLMCGEIIKYITKCAEPSTFNSYSIFNMVNFAFETRAWPRSEMCTACGGNASQVNHSRQERISEKNVV